MNLLLTNDDGIHAPGLRTLQDALADVGPITVVAPHEHLSGCSHQVSFGRPLQVTTLAENRHAVDGTPADCTRLGLLHLAPETEWVMSGINDGGNLGVDVYMSGTVAAVREAALLGKRGIAFSQYIRNHENATASDWSAAASMVRQVIEVLLSKPLQPGAFWNVNFPDPQNLNRASDLVFCPLETDHLPMQYKLQDGRYHYSGIYHERSKKPGHDVHVCFSGDIAITQILPHGSA